MPDGLTGAEAADRNAVLDDVRDDVDFRVPRDEALPVLLHRRNIEVAETTAERDQVIVGQGLIAKQQYLMVNPSLMKCREHRGVDPAQVDAAHFRADAAAGRVHIERQPILDIAMHGLLLPQTRGSQRRRARAGVCVRSAAIDNDALTRAPRSWPRNGDTWPAS